MANITARKNKDGIITSYMIRVYHGYDTNGKRLKPYVMNWKPAPGMTSKQIDKELNKQAVQFEEECINGLSGSATKITISEFCPRYLEINKENFSPLTYENYTRIINKLIIPALGHLKIQDIKPVHVQEFIKQLSKTPCTDRNGQTITEKNSVVQYLSASTIKRYLTVLQSIFRQAIKLGIIQSNPADSGKLTIPKAVTPKIQIFTKQEASRILECLENETLQFQVMIQLAILSGCRRGELTALKFSDFDRATSKITVERAAVKVKGRKTIIKPPKDFEVRQITIPAYCFDLVDDLHAEKKNKASTLGTYWHDNDWLFTQENGDIMNPQTPTKQFSDFLEHYGFEHRKFHSLRHSSATLLLYGGVNIKQVQGRLGHGSIETTNKYLHCIAEADEQASNVLQDMLISKAPAHEQKQA